jgi:hypothetical protein
VSDSKIKEMANRMSAVPPKGTYTTEEAFLDGALFALQEAASALLQDDHPKGGRSHRKDRVYAAWLRERAVHVGDG